MAMTEAEKVATPKDRRGVPSVSGTGSYPMNNAKQAGEAVALASMHHGSSSPFTQHIRAKASSLGYGKNKKFSRIGSSS